MDKYTKIIAVFTYNSDKCNEQTYYGFQFKLHGTAQVEGFSDHITYSQNFSKVLGTGHNRYLQLHEVVMKIAFRLHCRSGEQRRHEFLMYISDRCTLRHLHTYSTQKYWHWFVHTHAQAHTCSSIGGLTEVVHCAWLLLKFHCVASASRLCFAKLVCPCFLEQMKQ